MPWPSSKTKAGLQGDWGEVDGGTVQKRTPHTSCKSVNAKLLGKSWNSTRPSKGH